MADFCKACSEDLFGRDLEKPLNFGIAKDEYLVILCEGHGRCVRVNNEGEVIECNTCDHAEDGVCWGKGYGEIKGDGCCENWEKRK
jgi:hypothetical protein